jgi:hypothetical protein
MLEPMLEIASNNPSSPKIPGLASKYKIKI